MDLSLGNLLVSFFFSSVGFIYFRHGKRQALAVFMMVGMILMVYGYFVKSWAWNLVIGGVLSAVPFFLRQ